MGKKTPTPTPTECVPVVSATVAIGSTAGFNAQGTFSVVNKKQLRYRDETASGLWFSTPPNIVAYQQNGLFQGITPGCACISVAAGGFTSQNVSIQVGAPVPACTPCPQLPAPTPTPKRGG
ncbi:MAG: hypothetical protein ACREQ4_04835 [Candidatus Binataceae bacterium]